MKRTKLFKIFIALMVLMSQILSFVSSVNAAQIGETKDLERGEKGYYCVQKWNGSNWIYLTYNQTFYTDTDGQRYIAYCLSPGSPGVGYVSGEKETYQVNVTKLLEDDRVWRVLKNGYPNRSVSDLGVETEDDAYFATMQAINAILRGYTLEQARSLYSVGKFAINGEKFEDIQRRGEKTLNLMLNLMDIGLNGTETREQFLNISIKQVSNFSKENNNFYSQKFTIQSSSEISQYSIEKLEGLPEGSYITDENGKEKQTFSGSKTTFKVVIPGDKITSDIKGKVYIKAKQKNYPVYFGESALQGFQDYALCNNSYDDVNINTDISVKTNKSNLTIVKVDGETQKPIKGVKFKITYGDGTAKTYTTDKDGKIEIKNQRPGIITIKEISTVGKYRINTTENKVELKYNESKELKIENELKKGSIKIIKVDADDNKIKLSNVKFELKDEKNNVIKEGVTDKNGELLFKNVVIGKYKVVEVQSNSEYILSDEEITVEVIDGKTQKIEVENKKKEVPKKPEAPEQPEIPEEEEINELPNKELPKTGSDFGLLVMVSFTVVIATYSTFVIIRKMSKKHLIK